MSACFFSRFCLTALISFQFSLAYADPPRLGPNSACGESGNGERLLSAVKVKIFTNSAGLPTFSAKIKRGAKTYSLRKSFSDEQFFTEKPNLVAVNYSIAKSCGGVDITYNLQNLSDSPQRVPNFRVDGFMQNPNKPMEVLFLADYGNMVKVPKPAPLVLLDDAMGERNTHYYPGVYSPVVVHRGRSFAYGSALHYPILDYKHGVRMRLEQGTELRAGSWSHIYYKMRDEVEGVAFIPGKSRRSYTISVRFAPAEHWLVTLSPYRAYFNSLYRELATTRQRDLRPVYGISMASEGIVNATENPRGFAKLFAGPENPGGYRLDLDGWTPIIEAMKADMQIKGFARNMIWLPSGAYDESLPQVAPNFPAQIMSHWLPAMSASAYAFQTFADNSMQLGFWWGHAGQFPVEDIWNPPAYEVLDYGLPSHQEFIAQQLIPAIDLGANILGLDAVGNMPHSRRYIYSQAFQNQNVLAVHEGSPNDVLHSRFAAFYWPERHVDTWIADPGVKKEDALSLYLNPNREVWLFFQGEVYAFAHAPLVRLAPRLGYTPVLKNAEFDVSNISLVQYTCLDGIDNDFDSLVDYPLDPDCHAFSQDSE